MRNQKFFFLNGQKYFFKNSLTLLELLHYFKYDTFLFVLEYNNFICNKNEWDKIIIKNNDNIEIVTIVGGG